MSSTFICKDTTGIFLGKLSTSWHGRNLNLRGLHVVVGVARSVAFESSLGASGFKFRRGVLSRQPGTIPLRLGSQLERAGTGAAAPGRAGPGYGLGTPRAKCRPVLGACGGWAVPAAAGDPAPLAPQAEAEARTGSAAACPGPVAPAGLARSSKCQRVLLVPAGQVGTGWAMFTLPVAVASRPKSRAAGMAMITLQDAASVSSPSQRTYQNLPAPGA
jgi:hypothetical protein